MSENNIPARLSKIIEDFQFVDGREKIELLMEADVRRLSTMW